MCLSEAQRVSLFAQAKDEFADRIFKAAAVITQNDHPFSDFVRRQSARLNQIAKETVGHPDIFLEEVMQFLLQYHPAAHEIGQELATGQQAVQSFAQVYGRRVAYGDMSFIQAFALAIQARDKRLTGDDGEISLEKVQARLQLYLVKGSGTAQHGWSHSGPNRLVYWRLGRVEQHCLDCPYLADMGPYTTREDFQLEQKILPTTPRACDTPCLFNCSCWLEDSYGENTRWSEVYAA